MYLAIFAASATAAADPGPRAPDFSGTRPPAPADAALAASDGTQPIDPSAIVGFCFDSASLDDAARAEIDGVARWLIAHPDRNVVLQGHTDRLGTFAYNLDLSGRRALRVRDRLRRWGIAPDRIVVATYGMRDAHRGVDENDRKVEIFASPRPAAELASSVLASTKAEQVAWRDHGAVLAEQRMR